LVLIHPELSSGKRELEIFIQSNRACFDITPAAYAAGLLLRQTRESRIASVDHSDRDGVLISLRLAA